MNTSITMQPSSIVAMTLAQLRSKGVHLWCENGQLRFKAPKGALSPEELNTLKAHRDTIKDLLEQAEGLEQLEPYPVERPQRGPLPLAYTQIAHWSTERLWERRIMRVVASSTQLQGPLNVEHLQVCLAEMVRRHEALRTRIVLVDGVPMQVVEDFGDHALEVHDLSSLPQMQKDMEAKRLTAQCLKQTIDVTIDPLFAAWLLRLSDNEHVLILAMEHIIADGISSNILLKDLFDAYEQASNGPITLPPVQMQFSDFACWQHSLEGAFRKRYEVYWATYLEGGHRTCLPRDLSASWQTPSALGALSLRIDGELLERLRYWSRTHATTPSMTLLTAYAAFILRWCDLAQTVIQCQTEGRVGQRIQRTIGYFSFTLYVKAELYNHDNFLSLKQRIVESYCNAHDHTEFGYIKARLPGVGVTKNTTFNWTMSGPRYEGFTVNSPEGVIAGSMCPIGKLEGEGHEMDEEPAMGWLDFNDHIFGFVSYPSAGFSSGRMEEFCQQFLAFTGELLARPYDLVSGVPLSAPVGR